MQGLVDAGLVGTAIRSPALPDLPGIELDAVALSHKTQEFALRTPDTTGGAPAFGCYEASAPASVAESPPDGAMAGAGTACLRTCSCDSWLSLLMSILHPVNRAASLAF